MEQLPFRFKIGYNKTLTVKRNDSYINSYINDNVFEDGRLIKEKSKYVWLKFEELLKLRDAINTIEQRVQESEEVVERNVSLFCI